VSARFEELDWQKTPIGTVSLRRRREPLLGVEVYEVKLDDEYLMSSLFTVAEIELARLGLGALAGSDLDVVVGGLGLGYTGRAVLDDPRVRSLIVVELLDAVIGWHRDAILPFSAALTSGSRSRLVQGDFFAMAAGINGFDPDAPGRLFDAILLDIDHTPSHLLDPSHAAFYRPEGLRRMLRHLRPHGVFALWSDDPPNPTVVASLGQVFSTATAHVVNFPNPLHGGTSTNTVYVARR
jgi:spermidine synthase